MVGVEFIQLLWVFKGKVGPCLSGKAQMSCPTHLLLRSPTDIKNLNLREGEKLFFKGLIILTDWSGFLGNERYVQRACEKNHIGLCNHAVCC